MPLNAARLPMRYASMRVEKGLDSRLNNERYPSRRLYNDRTPPSSVTDNQVTVKGSVLPLALILSAFRLHGYVSLKTLNTFSNNCQITEGAVSRNILYYQQLSIAC